MSLAEVYQKLIDPKQFNFFHDLIQLDDSNSIKKTVELFAFGDINLLSKYHSEFELDEHLYNKLVQLTLIEISNIYSNQSISFDQVEKEFGLRDPDFEIIKLVDLNIINVKIDCLHNQFIFGDVVTIRDIYDDKLYKLHVLQESDLFTLNNATSIITNWYHQKLRPVKDELINDTQSKRVDMDPATRISEQL